MGTKIMWNLQLNKPRKEKIKEMMPINTFFQNKIWYSIFFLYFYFEY